MTLFDYCKAMELQKKRILDEIVTLFVLNEPWDSTEYYYEQVYCGRIRDIPYIFLRYSVNNVFFHVGSNMIYFDLDTYDE